MSQELDGPLAGTWRVALGGGGKGKAAAGGEPVLGHVESEADAARMYDRALLLREGGYAETSFPASDYGYRCGDWVVRGLGSAGIG